MTGLDKILNEIQKDATDTADRIISEAEDKAKEILAKAEEEASVKVNSIRNETATAEKDILSRAKSTGELSVRKALLLKKQEIINNIIGQAKEQLLALPDGEYFDFLNKALTKFAHGENGEIILNKKDKARLNESFKTAIAQNNLTLSDKELKSEGGFILSYGGIEENCTFDALIEEKKEQLMDLVSQTVFN